MVVDPKKKPVFKQDPWPGGLANVGFIRGANIKLGGKVVGRIRPPHRFGGEREYSVALIVENENSSGDCNWRWGTLQVRFASLDDAKTWVRLHWSELVAAHKISTYQLD